MKTHLVYLILILLVSLFCMKALLHPGLFTAHDISHQVARLYWYKASVSEGVFPPQWVAPLANGFGYPLFIFSYHFPWMVGLPFLFVGFSIESTLKILFIISYLLSGWGMYCLCYLITKNKLASFVSAFLYIVAPWRFVVIFVSAAIGKAFVFTLFPFIAIGVYLSAKSKHVLFSVFVLSLSLAALVLSHLISFLTVGLLLVPFILYLRPQVKRLALALGVSVILTSWYVFPILKLSSNIAASSGSFKSLYLSQFISLKQLLYSPWGYGIVNASAKEGAFSYQLGIAQWVVLLSSLVFIVWKIKNGAKIREYIFVLYLVLASLVGVFLMLESSIPLWRVASKALTFDYPTMFLTPVLFIASFLASIIVSKTDKWTSMPLSVLLIVLALVNNRNYMRVNEYTNNSIESVVAMETTTNTFNEYLPLSADVNVMAQNKVEEVEGEGVSSVFAHRKASSYEVSFDKKVEGVVKLKVFAFPGLELILNGSKASYAIDDIGRVTIFVKEGKQLINISYTGQ